MGGVRVQHDQLGKRVVLELVDKIEPGEAGQIVEAVTVLQVFQLVLEYEVEGRAQHAAERHDLLGQAADPQVDVVDAGDGNVVERMRYAIGTNRARPGAGAVEEVETVVRRGCTAEHDVHGRGALAGQGGLDGDAGMGAVGGDEVDERFGVAQELHVVEPAGIGSQATVPGYLVEVAPRRIERGNAGVAAARQVDGGKVERQAQQVVAQGFGLELVDLVADLPRGAAHDGAGSLLGGEGIVLIEGQRIEEGLDQADLARGKLRIEAVDLVLQHRGAEAIDDVRELGDDGGIDVGVIDLGGGKERVDVRLNFARKLLEHQVLVLHLGAELGRLEQALAIPDQAREVSGHGGDRNEQPLIEERHIAGRRRLQQHRLGVIDEAIVLGVEDVMHGGEADVLVDPAIAAHEVLVDELVVVGA